MTNRTERLSFEAFARGLRWIDGRPLLAVIEPYRLKIFRAFFDDRDTKGAPSYSVGLFGRSKKCWKSGDAMIAALRAVSEEWSAGSQVYVLANDKDQSRDDLVLLDKIVRANPLLEDRLTVRKNIIERKDGRGFVEVLPAQDVAGTHGKTFRLVIFDEIHAYRTFDLFEALAFDPTRPEAQWWITSYASLFHRPGAPLHDLMAVGKAGSDPRMLFSWYAADFTTDPAFAAATPEDRANPSRASWKNPAYLEQQRRLLPAHKYRRLHLNLPGMPEGSAFQHEPVTDAVDRGVAVRLPEDGIAYAAFVDMSGGSSDDSVLAVAHSEADGRIVLDRVVDQGARPPFDPRAAVERFVAVLREYGVTSVTGDAYAGQTFVRLFERHGIAYTVSPSSKHELYEALEPLLNARRVRLLDVPVVEQQLLGLVWRGSRIDHPGGEHDDWANACAGVAVVLGADDSVCEHCGAMVSECAGMHLLGGVESLTPEQRAFAERLLGRSAVAGIGEERDARRRHREDVTATDEDQRDQRSAEYVAEAIARDGAYWPH